MLSVDPRLAEERANPRNAGIDGGLRFAAKFFFLLTLTVAALSVGRLGFLFKVPIPLRDTALFVFALSSSLQTWAMLVNPFFSPAVRLQTERGHFRMRRKIPISMFTVVFERPLALRCIT